MSKVENKKWCSYHKKIEPVSNFQKDIYKSDGLQNSCRQAQNKYMESYNDAHRDAINEKGMISQKYRQGKITRLQKIELITNINKKYGITTRLK